MSARVGNVGRVPALTTRDATIDDFDALIEVRARSFKDVPRARGVEGLCRRRGRGPALSRRRGTGSRRRRRRVWDFGQWWCGRAVPMGGIEASLSTPSTARAVLRRC